MSTVQALGNSPVTMAASANSPKDPASMRLAFVGLDASRAAVVVIAAVIR